MKEALFENYHKNVKPDGQVLVKGGMSISHFNLIPERKVIIDFSKIKISLHLGPDKQTRADLNAKWRQSLSFAFEFVKQVQQVSVKGPR